MRIYGFDEADISQGELQTDEVDGATVRDWPIEQLAEDRGWEFASTSLASAKKALLARMKAEGADKELLDGVRSIKAYFFD